MTIFNRTINIHTPYFNIGTPPIFNYNTFSPFNNWFPNFNFNFFNFNFFNLTPPCYNDTSNNFNFSFDLKKIFPTDVWGNASQIQYQSNSNLGSIWNNNWTPGIDFSNVHWGDTFVKSPDASNKLNETNSNNTISGYSSKLGEKLANVALNNSKYVIDKGSKTLTSQTKAQNDFTGNCAMYVKAAIRDAGLGEYEFGHAYELAGILRKNKNFKEISPSEYNVKSLPAGCILVYNKGSQNYNKKFGHTEITTGDGRAASDGITQNLYKKPDAIFVPVAA